MSRKDHGALDRRDGLPLTVRPQEYRFRSRTPTTLSHGLVFSLTFVLLGSIISTSQGQGCTPVFEGFQIGSKSTRNVIKVIEGASFNLTCNLSRLHNFGWRLNKSDPVHYDNSHFSAKSPVSEGGNVRTELHVKDVRRNHSGEYTCIGAGCQRDEPYHGLTIKVIYAEQPKIVHPQRDNYSELIIDIGKNLEIRCESKADVHEGVIWQKESVDGSTSKWRNMEDVCKKRNEAVPDKTKSSCYVTQKFENKTKILTLNITYVRAEDFGRYGCGIPIPDDPNSIEKAKNDLISLRVAGKSKAGSRAKRSAGHGGWVKPPPKHEGIYWKDLEILGENKETLKITRKFDKGTNSTIVLEGDAATLFCNLTRTSGGEPGGDSPVSGLRFQVGWKIGGKYFAKGELLQIPVLKDRYEYREAENWTQIIINPVNITDKGWFQCLLWDSGSPGGRKTFSAESIVTTFEIRLRVKEKMAPLYPFISICVEVVIIFLIIFIYEKSKSKEQVEDSDTDGSPDQKNVSDNGEGVSEATRLAKE